MAYCLDDMDGFKMSDFPIYKKASLYEDPKPTTIHCTKCGKDVTQNLLHDCVQIWPPKPTLDERRDELAQKYSLDSVDLCHYVDFKAGWDAAIAEMQVEISGWNDKYNAKVDDLIIAEAENEKLREALEEIYEIGNTRSGKSAEARIAEKVLKNE